MSTNHLVIFFSSPHDVQQRRVKVCLFCFCILLLHLLQVTDANLKPQTCLSYAYDLVKQGDDRSFARAVVYFLYDDPDRSMQMVDSDLFDAGIASGWVGGEYGKGIILNS